jgi:hypothetical protein
MLLYPQHYRASETTFDGGQRMTESESSIYTVDFRDSANCSRIENVQPGEEIQVLVRPEQGTSATPIIAKGTRSQDGTTFMIEVTTADGHQQSFEWEYPLLKLIAQLLQPLL